MIWTRWRQSKHLSKRHRLKNQATSPGKDISDKMHSVGELLMIQLLKILSKAPLLKFLFIAVHGIHFVLSPDPHWVTANTWGLLIFRTCLQQVVYISEFPTEVLSCIFLKQFLWLEECKQWFFSFRFFFFV